MENIVRYGAPNISPVMSAKRLAGRSNRGNEVRIARGLDDLLMVYTIRLRLYGGTGHCATHFIGFVRGEPAGCLRVRFFSEA